MIGECALGKVPFRLLSIKKDKLQVCVVGDTSLNQNDVLDLIEDLPLCA